MMAAVHRDLKITMHSASLSRFMGRFRRRVAGDLDDWLIEVGDLGLQIMTEESPVKTGELRASIKVVRTSKATIEVYPTAEHALYVQRGTRPHIIRGKPVLSWIGADGKRIFARKVSHPGTRPNPFITRSRNRLFRRARQLLINKIKQSFRRSR